MMIDVSLGQYSIVYECGEDALEGMQNQLVKLLKDVRLVHNTVIKVEDTLQDFETEITIIHK